MPQFSYSALSADGVRVTGEGAAISEQELRAELRARGLLVQEVRRRRGSWLGLGRQRVRPDQFLMFNQEFMALVRAGLPIPDALALAANRPDDPNLGRVLAKVLEDVRGGALFSAACARYPDVFDGLYLSALGTGEKTGDLTTVLTRYQEYLRHRVALRKRLSQALTYPAFLLIALAVILAVLFTFVLPRFVAMYADFGAALPWPTRILIGIVDRLYLFGPLAIALGVAVMVAWRRLAASPAGRLWWDGLQERLPYAGDIQRTVSAAQLARSLSTLLAGGTPLVEALNTARGALANRAYVERLGRALQRVTEGGSLADAVRSEALMPETAARMIAVGEAAGSLDKMLAEVAQFYEEQLDTRLARVMALVEPLLMLLMGVLIGGIIIVMYLPIFNMADIIK
jgi:type IV pilus assembly protein PilC